MHPHISSGTTAERTADRGADFDRIRVTSDAQLQQAVSSLSGGAELNSVASKLLEVAVVRSGFSSSDHLPLQAGSSVVEALRNGDAVLFPQVTHVAVAEDCAFVCRGALLFGGGGNQFTLRLLDQNGYHYDYQVEATIYDLQRRSEAPTPFSQGIVIPSNTIWEQKGFYPFIRIDWMSDSSPVAIRPLETKQRGHELLRLTDASAELVLAERPGEKFIQTFAAAGIAVEDAVLLDHQKLGLRFIVPHQLSAGIYVCATEKDGAAALLPLRSDWHVSADILSRVIPVQFSWTSADGEEQAGFLHHVPGEMDILAVRAGGRFRSALAHDLHILESVVSSTRTDLDTLTRRSMGFRLSELISRERQEALTGLRDLAGDLDAAYRQFRRFSGDGIGTTPVQFMEQLNLLVPSGLVEHPQTSLSVQIREQMGISPNRRVEFAREDNSVALDFYIPGGSPIYTLSIDMQQMTPEVGEKYLAVLHSQDFEGTSHIAPPQGTLRGTTRVTLDSLLDVVSLFTRFHQL